MNMSKPTPVPAPKQIPNIVETSGGSRRFKRLKLYARTITKSGKERRNAAPVASKDDTGMTQETIKGGSKKLGGEPEFLLVLPPNNFDTLVKRNFEGSQYSTSHLYPPLLLPKPVDSTPGVKDGRAFSAGERQQQLTVNNEREDSPQPGRFSAGSQSSLLPLSNAFRDTVYSDSDGVLAWALPQKPTDSPKSVKIPSGMSLSPPMSPSFLNPRQAPHPPTAEADDPDLTVLSVASITTGQTGNSCAATIASSDSAQSSKYNTSAAEDQPPGFIASSSLSDPLKTLPSTGSGLARIGAALLGYDHLSDDECLLISSYSSLDAHEMDDQSLGSLLDAMERHGAFVRELPQSHTSESVATFVLPSMNSAPANLADSSFSLNDLLSSNSRNISKNMRVKSLLRASFTETLSNLEQLLQDQGVTVPSSRNLVELWQALSIGVGRDSFTGSQGVETMQSIAKCDPQDKSRSFPPTGTHLSALPNHIMLERIEDLLKSRPQDQACSVSNTIRNDVLATQTETVASIQDPLLFEEGDSRGPGGVGIAI